MSEYIDIIIQMLNEYTEGKTDLTNLGLFLAQENNASALRILKTTIQATQYNKLRKNIDVNRQISIYTTTFFGETKEHKENIPSRLANNQLYLSREVLEYIAKTQRINFNFKSYGVFSLHEHLAKILIDINNPQSNFYKRKDIANKNLEILEYFIKKGIIKLDRRSQYSNYIYNLFINFIQDNPSDIEVNTTINRILFSNDKEKTSYDDTVKQNLEKYLCWSNIREVEKENISNDDCHYFGSVIVPAIKEKIIILK